MTRKNFATKRLIVRPLSLRDYKTWLESQEKMGEPRTKFDPKPLPKQRRGYEKFKESVLRHRRQDKKDIAYIWNIFLRTTGELIGHIDISTIERDPYQMANLGYCILTRYQGQGYATEALKKIIAAGFEDLKFHRLEAVTDLDNKASRVLAKKCGLYYEGIKKHYWFQNNRWEDQAIYIATPELWKKK